MLILIISKVCLRLLCEDGLLAIVFSHPCKGGKLKLWANGERLYGRVYPLLIVHIFPPSSYSQYPEYIFIVRCILFSFRGVLFMIFPKIMSSEISKGENLLGWRSLMLPYLRTFTLFSDCLIHTFIGLRMVHRLK